MGGSGLAQHHQENFRQQAEQDEQDDDQPGRHGAQQVGEDEVEPLLFEEGPVEGGGFRHSRTSGRSIPRLCHFKVERRSPSPDDATPEKAEEHVEGQGAPDDKVVDPSPVTRVQGQLQGHSDSMEVLLRCRAPSATQSKPNLPDAQAYLERNCKHHDCEDYCAKGPVPIHLKKATEETQNDHMQD